MKREGEKMVIRLTIPDDRERWRWILERRPDAAQFEGLLGTEVEVDLASANFVKYRRMGHELFVEVTLASGESAMVPVRIVQAMAQTQFGLEVFMRMFQQAFGRDSKTPHASSTKLELAPL